MEKVKNQFWVQRRWSLEEDAQIRDLSYMDAADIAARLGRSTSAVYTRAADLRVVIGLRSKEPIPEPYMQRLAARQIALNHTVNDGLCWVWSGYTKKNGYGYMTLRGIVDGAHRWSYRAFKGPLSAGLFVCHSCDNRSCVNPDHLWLGTASQNTRDMVKKGRTKDRRGSKNTVAKMTDAGCLEIRESCHSPSDVKRLATKYECSPATIRDIKARRTWVHL